MLARLRAQPWGGLVQGGFEDWRLVYWDGAVSGRYGAGIALKVNWGCTMEAIQTWFCRQWGDLGVFEDGVRKSEHCLLVEYEE